MRLFRYLFLRLLMAAALCAAAGACAAGERWSELADTVFQHLARDGELPESTVPTALAQDAEGYVWIGSQGGLARWDGYHFHVYRARTGVAGALPDNAIQSLHTDARGVLWVGTISGGLARYDRNRESFVSYPVGPKGVSNVSIRGIVDDGLGGVWVGTEGGLDHIAASGSITHLRHIEGDPGSLPDDRVLGLFRDRRGSLWIGTARGLVRRDPGVERLVTMELPALPDRQPVADAFLEDDAGRIWIGTVRDGAFVIPTRGAAAQVVQESEQSAASLRSVGVTALVEPSPGHVWLGTVGQGIVSVDVETGRTRHLRHDSNLPGSLTDNTIEAMLSDRSGLVWVCSLLSVSTYDPAQTALVTVFGASNRHDGISERSVDAILPMPDGRVWLGLDTNGVDIFDPDGARVADLRPDPAHPQTALPKDYINAFATGDDGDVYIGTEQGLYRSDSAARSAIRIPIAGRDVNGAVWALFRAGDVLWVGGNGLWAVDLTSSRGSPPARALPVRGLTDQRVTSIARDADGVIWVGTKNGLNRIDPTTHSVERILPSATDPAALSAPYVTAVLCDERGRIWASTFGGGVDVMSGRDAQGRPSFRRIGLGQGLPNEDTDMLLEDREHRIWVSTDDGLAEIDPATLAVRAIRRAEGLSIASYWAGAGAVTARGELLFGSILGLTIVQPEKLTAWTYEPPVVVTDIRIGGKPVIAGSLGLDAAVSPLRVRPGANSIAVEFASLDYSSPERNRYAYRLEGFDAGWVDSEATHRLATYTNLPPGQYRLHLRGSNRAGAWSGRERVLPIEVLPAWYQTVGFRVGVALAALGLVFALIQIRTFYLRRTQRDLERQVVARTAELRESQRQLEKIAYFDTLTALPNRRRFTEEARDLIAIAQSRNVRFALLLIDLDRFKQVNDSQGHDAGDALLIEAAIRLQAAVRKSDCVARLGGDEFAVLVAHNPAAQDVDHICARIIESFVMPVSVNGEALRSTASIGVAVLGDHGDSLDKLYKSADLALYEAKRAGGNGWRWCRGNVPSPAAPTIATSEVS